MPAVAIWAKCVGEDGHCDWSSLLEALRAGGAIQVCGEPGEPGLPGLLFVPAVNDEAKLELSARRGDDQGPIIVVAPNRGSLVGQGHWQLFQAGAADLVILEECRDPVAAIAARLERMAEVEAIIGAPVVRDNLVGQSRAWRGALRRVVEVARFSAAPLLITGESGTGKELVARLVHTLDPRPNKQRLVVMDCTTVSPELSGSEFFGHERGAFTNAVAAREGVFALAHEGTLFLDEVGELPPGLQAELLRAVQERAYKRVGSNNWQQTNFRLVCATNRDLAAEEARGNFRLDFFHRIAGARCCLPPLRDRREDIIPLARHLLRQELNAAAPLDFDPTVRDFLLTRDYPGNVRELGQLVRRIALRHVGPGPVTFGAIPPEDREAAVDQLTRDWRDAGFEQALRRALATGAGLPAIREQTAEAVIDIALRDAGGNLHRAATRLGVTDRALQMRRAARLDPVRGNNGNGNGHGRVPKVELPGADGEREHDTITGRNRQP